MKLSEQERSFIPPMALNCLPGIKAVKIKTVQGSKSGVIGFNTSDALKNRICNKIIKTAGVSDYLALNSQLITAKKNQKYLVFTNSGGVDSRFANMGFRALS